MRAISFMDLKYGFVGPIKRPNASHGDVYMRICGLVRLSPSFIRQISSRSPSPRAAVVAKAVKSGQFATGILYRTDDRPAVAADAVRTLW